MKVCGENGGESKILNRNTWVHSISGERFRRKDHSHRELAQSLKTCLWLAHVWLIPSPLCTHSPIPSYFPRAVNSPRWGSTYEPPRPRWWKRRCSRASTRSWWAPCTGGRKAVWWTRLGRTGRTRKSMRRTSVDGQCLPIISRFKNVQSSELRPFSVIPHCAATYPPLFSER